ncbi:hypothetical protein E6C27_scaffold174G001360 [Cucumis melo var. makuwa]|uniref:Uncharacterized protein n=1 Tax=Cucumis melo var. makuwa TaxID=1194695 RepID=A0A5A7U769_CUCMM|nr:hypothetical protein E6C27_scaffold174G001360 [Cucumis melo var. makuwa]
MQKELVEKLKKIPLLKMHVQTLSPVLTLAIASNSAIVLMELASMFEYDLK